MRPDETPRSSGDADDAWRRAHLAEGALKAVRTPGGWTRSTAEPLKILIVDDELPVRELLARYVTALGYRPYSASYAEEALRVLRRRRMDLVMVDIRMPGRDGGWLIEQAHARWPSLPMLIVTGVEELDPHITLQPGVVGYLVKPFTAEALGDALRRALSGPDED